MLDPTTIKFAFIFSRPVLARRTEIGNDRIYIAIADAE